MWPGKTRGIDQTASEHPVSVFSASVPAESLSLSFSLSRLSRSFYPQPTASPFLYLLYLANTVNLSSCMSSVPRKKPCNQIADMILQGIPHHRSSPRLQKPTGASTMRSPSTMYISTLPSACGQHGMPICGTMSSPLESCRS